MKALCDHLEWVAMYLRGPLDGETGKKIAFEELGKAMAIAEILPEVSLSLMPIDDKTAVKLKREIPEPIIKLGSEPDWIKPHPTKPGYSIIGNGGTEMDVEG